MVVTFALVKDKEQDKYNLNKNMLLEISLLNPEKPWKD